MRGSEDLAAASEGRPFPSDLADVVERCRPAFQELANSRILVTGGTGFVGRWLLETLLNADRALGLNVRVTLLTRDPSAFRRRAPQIADADAVTLIEGDVRTLELAAAKFDRIVHLAAETNTQLNDPRPEDYLDVIVGGTRRVLEIAEGSSARSVFVVSSGAVYGNPSMIDRPFREDDPFGPLPMDPTAAYGEAKRCAEMLAYAVGRRTGMQIAVARCFAFVGPYLPVASGFAVGNFIRDALLRGEIVVTGDGTPRRTYLYAADMAAWLWTIALFGRSGRPYNVGSDEAVTIADLAHLVASAVSDDVGVRILGERSRVGAGTSYIPDVARARTELGLTVSVPLQDALHRTIAWHRQANDIAAMGVTA